MYYIFGLIFGLTIFHIMEKVSRTVFNKRSSVARRWPFFAIRTFISIRFQITLISGHKGHTTLKSHRVTIIVNPVKMRYFKFL